MTDADGGHLDAVQLKHLFKCDHCLVIQTRRSAQQRYCDECRPKAQALYSRRWAKRHRPRLRDHEPRIHCPDCGEMFDRFSGERGGMRKRCEPCRAKRTREMARRWRASAAGKASRERERRRRNGESIPDRRLGPRWAT